MAASTSLTSQQRRLRAQIAAHAQWANCDDPAAHTAPARAAFLDRFEKQADPDGVLTLEERARRAEHLRKQYFKTMALKSSRARAAKAAQPAADGGGRS